MRYGYDGTQSEAYRAMLGEFSLLADAPIELPEDAQQKHLLRVALQHVDPELGFLDSAIDWSAYMMAFKAKSTNPDVY